MLKSFADGSLFGRTWGQGRASVLALHGWRRSHQDFRAVFDDPTFTGDPSSGGHAALAVDLFGFGATPPPPEPWGTEGFAGHLVPLFADGGPLAERVVVVGHSLGGRVAVRLARLVPDRVERLVLTGVPLLPRQGRRARPATAFRVARRLHRLGMVGDDRMERARRRYGSPDYRAAEGVMREVLVRMLAERYDGDLEAIESPVDLVWGDSDGEVPLEVAERAAGLLRRATLDVLPGVGHFVPTEAPSELRAVVLGRVGPGKGSADGSADGSAVPGPREGSV